MSPLVEQLHTVIARLLESEQLVAQQTQLAAEIAIEEQKLTALRKEKLDLAEELKQLRAEVDLERRNVEHWKAEMLSLRQKLSAPSIAA